MRKLRLDLPAAPNCRACWNFAISRRRSFQETGLLHLLSHLGTRHHGRPRPQHHRTEHHVDHRRLLLLEALCSPFSVQWLGTEESKIQGSTYSIKLKVALSLSFHNCFFLFAQASTVQSDPAPCL